MGVEGRANRRVLESMSPLTDRATHFGIFRFLEPQPNVKETMVPAVVSQVVRNGLRSHPQ